LTRRHNFEEKKTCLDCGVFAIFKSQFSDLKQQASILGNNSCWIYVLINWKSIDLIQSFYPNKHSSNPSQFWNGRNLSTLLPLLSIYLLILTVLEIAQRCHVTRMSCSIANAHYALLKAIFPRFNICVDSHKDILCLCDIWTCSLYWKMDSNSPDKCFFLGVFSFNLKHSKSL